MLFRQTKQHWNTRGMITKLGNKIHNKLANVFHIFFTLFISVDCRSKQFMSTHIFFMRFCSVPWKYLKTTNPAGNYMFKVNNRNTRTRFEICLKLTRKTLERRYWRRSGDFIIYFEHVSHLALVFLLLTLSR